MEAPLFHTGVPPSSLSTRRLRSGEARSGTKRIYPAAAFTHAEDERRDHRWPGRHRRRSLSAPMDPCGISLCPDPCGSRAEAKTKASGYGRALRAQSVWAFKVWGACMGLTAHLCLHSPKGPANPLANPLTWIGRPGSPFSRSSGGPEPARHFIGRSHRRTLASLCTSAPPRRLPRCRFAPPPLARLSDRREDGTSIALEGVGSDRVL